MGFSHSELYTGRHRLTLYNAITPSLCLWFCNEQSELQRNQSSSARNAIIDFVLIERRRWLFTLIASATPYLYAKLYAACEGACSRHGIYYCLHSRCPKPVKLLYAMSTCMWTTMHAVCWLPLRSFTLHTHRRPEKQQLTSSCHAIGTTLRDYSNFVYVCVNQRECMTHNYDVCNTKSDWSNLPQLECRVYFSIGFLVRLQFAVAVSHIAKNARNQVSNWFVRGWKRRLACLRRRNRSSDDNMI